MKDIYTCLTELQGAEGGRLAYCNTLQCLERSGRSTRQVVHGPRHMRCCPSSCCAPSRAHHAGGCCPACGMYPGLRDAALGQMPQVLTDMPFLGFTMV